MRVHKAIVGATLGGLLTIVALVIGLWVVVEGNGFAGAQRLVVASLLQVVAMLVIMRMIARPGPRRRLTWATAMLGAVLVSGLSLLALGLVPHEFLTYAGAELHWDRRDLIMIDLPVLPFGISRQAVRDAITAGMYTNSFVAALAMWIMWQRRHDEAEARAQARQEEPAPVPAGTSAYGRPLSKQG